MALNTKEIKLRINGVKNTKKISKAMEMVSVVKMNRSITKLGSIKDYHQSLLKTLSEIEIPDGYTNPLLQPNDGGKRLLVVIGANRGLCGAYNSRIAKESSLYLDEHIGNVDSIAVGKKAVKPLKSKKSEPLYLFDTFDNLTQFEDILGLTKAIYELYLSGEYSQVDLISTNFINMLQNKSAIKQILPMVSADVSRFSEGGSYETDLKGTDKFEPSAIELLDILLPRIFEVEIFVSVISSLASEHSSRMVAMKNATKAAGKFIDRLTLEYNKARQAAITQEIAEIVAPLAVLED